MNIFHLFWFNQAMPVVFKSYFPLKNGINFVLEAKLVEFIRLSYSSIFQIFKFIFYKNINCQENLHSSYKVNKKKHINILLSMLSHMTKIISIMKNKKKRFDFARNFCINKFSFPFFYYVITEASPDCCQRVS